MAVAQSLESQENEAAKIEERSSVESFGHFLARECQVILEICVVVSIIATIGMMITLWFLAIIPATIGLMSYGLLMLANAVERRTDHQVDDTAGVESDSADRVSAETVIHDDQTIAEKTPQHLVDTAVQRRLTRVSIECLIGAGVLAIVLAGSVLSFKVVSLGVLILFCYIILVTAPVWLAWLEKDMEDEVDHQRELANK